MAVGTARAQMILSGYSADDVGPEDVPILLFAIALLLLDRAPARAGRGA